MLKPGDIIVVNLDPTIGQEKQKTRYCLVLEGGDGTPLDLIIVLPITEHHASRNKYFFVEILNYQASGLSKPSCIDCYQIRTISLQRVKKEKNGEIFILGKVNIFVLNEVKKRLALILDITEEHLDLSY